MSREKTIEEEWMSRNGLKYNDSGISIEEETPISIIKWQTGEPKTHGRYFVQTKEDGFQIAFWSAYVQSWSLYHNSEIIAWCKLSDIKPYKEEKQ